MFQSLSWVCYFSRIFALCLKDLGARLWVFGIRRIACFHWISIFGKYIKGGQRSRMGLNICIITHLMCTYWSIMWLKIFFAFLKSLFSYSYQTWYNKRLRGTRVISSHGSFVSGQWIIFCSISKFMLYVSFGSRHFMGLNTNPSVCPSILHFGGFQWGLWGYIRNVVVRDNTSLNY